MTTAPKGLLLKTLLENPELLHQPNYSGACTSRKEEKKDPALYTDVLLGQSAFLGHELWAKTLPYDVTSDLTDFKLECMNLDEFFAENDFLNDIIAAPVEQMETQEENSEILGEDILVPQTKKKPSPYRSSNPLPQTTNPLPQTTNPSPRTANVLPRKTNLLLRTTNPFPRSQPKKRTLSVPSSSYGSYNDIDTGNDPPSPIISDLKVEFDVDNTDLALASVPGEEEFDPRRKRFSIDELKPQPLIKKSRKTYVPEDLKDDQYWQRRTKNNVAAKRSRDARRIKENQIALRTAYLEKENGTLKAKLKKALEDLDKLRAQVGKYEPVM